MLLEGVFVCMFSSPQSLFVVDEDDVSPFFRLPMFRMGEAAYEDIIMLILKGNEEEDVGS